MGKWLGKYSANCVQCGNEVVLFDEREDEDVWTHGAFTPFEDLDHKAIPDL